jgi:hypothetical protein
MTKLKGAFRGYMKAPTKRSRKRTQDDFPFDGQSKASDLYLLLSSHD